MELEPFRPPIWGVPPEIAGPAAGAIAAICVMAAGALLVHHSGQEDQRQRARSAFLRVLANTAISHDELASYEQSEAPIGRALIEVADPGISDEVKTFLRKALAASL